MMSSMANVEISTLIRRGYIFSAILGVISLTLIYFLYQSIQEERIFIERKIEFRELGHNLEKASDLLTREARLYAVLGDESNYDAYWHEVKVTKTRDNVIARLKELDVSDVELSLLEEAKDNSDSLIRVEEASFAAVADGEMIKAQQLMFDENYLQLKEKIKRPIRNFMDTMNTRADREAAAAEGKAVILLELTIGMFILFAFTVAFMMNSLFVKNISRPLETISKAILAISQGDTSIEIPYADAKNEIGTLAGSAVLFKESLVNNQKLAATNQNLAVELSTSKNYLERELERQSEEMKEMSRELRTIAKQTSRELQEPLDASIQQLKKAKMAMENLDQPLAESNLQMAQDDLQKLNRLIDEAFEASSASKNEVNEEDEKEITFAS